MLAFVHRMQCLKLTSYFTIRDINANSTTQIREATTSVLWNSLHGHNTSECPSLTLRGAHWQNHTLVTKSELTTNIISTQRVICSSEANVY